MAELQSQGNITQGLVDEANASKGQTPSTNVATGQYTGGPQAAQQVAAYDRAFEAPGRLDMPLVMAATSGYMPGSQPAYNQAMYPIVQQPAHDAAVCQAQAAYMNHQYMADLRARFPEPAELVYKATPTTSKEVEEVLAKVNKPSKFVRPRRTETKARILPPVSPSAVVCGKCGALLDLGSQPKGRYMVCGSCNSPLHETETCRLDAVRKRVRELGRDHTELHEEEESEEEETEEREEQEDETKTTRWSPRRIPSPNSFRPWNRGGNRNFSNPRPPWEKKRSPTPDEEFPGVKPKKVKFQGPQRDAGWERKSNPRSRSNSREREEDTRRNNVQARENRRFKSNPWRSNQPAATPEPWRNSNKEDPIRQVARAVQMAKVMVDEQTMMQRVAALATSTTPQRQPDLAGLQQVMQQVAQPHFNISSGHSNWPKTGMMAFGYGYKPQEDAEEDEDGKEGGASQTEGPPQAAVAASTVTRGHTVTIEEVSDDEPEQVGDSSEEGILSWQEEPEHDQPRRRRESARRQLEAVAYTTRTTSHQRRSSSGQPTGSRPHTRSMSEALLGEVPPAAPTMEIVTGVVVAPDLHADTPHLTTSVEDGGTVPVIAQVINAEADATGGPPGAEEERPSGPEGSEAAATQDGINAARERAALAIGTAAYASARAMVAHQRLDQARKQGKKVKQASTLARQTLVAAAILDKAAADVMMETSAIGEAAEAEDEPGVDMESEREDMEPEPDFEEESHMSPDPTGVSKKRSTSSPLIPPELLEEDDETGHTAQSHRPSRRVRGRMSDSTSDRRDISPIVHLSPHLLVPVLPAPETGNRQGGWNFVTDQPRLLAMLDEPVQGIKAMREKVLTTNLHTRTEALARLCNPLRVQGETAQVDILITGGRESGRSIAMRIIRDAIENRASVDFRVVRQNNSASQLDFAMDEFELLNTSKHETRYHRYWKAVVRTQFMNSQLSDFVTNDLVLLPPIHPEIPGIKSNIIVRLHDGGDSDGAAYLTEGWEAAAAVAMNHV